VEIQDNENIGISNHSILIDKEVLSLMLGGSQKMRSLEHMHDARWYDGCTM